MNAALLQLAVAAIARQLVVSFREDERVEVSDAPSRQFPLGAATPTHVRVDKGRKGLSLDSRPDDGRHTARYESVIRPIRLQSKTARRRELALVFVRAPALNALFMSASSKGVTRIVADGNSKHTCYEHPCTFRQISMKTCSTSLTVHVSQYMYM